MVYSDPSDARGKEAKRRWYVAHKDRYLEYANRTRAKVRDFLQAAKNKPCADCKKRYPYYVMDFDHRPEFQKEWAIATLPRFGSIERARTEIEKCDVVCSNCHRERTFKRRENKKRIEKSVSSET